MAALLLAGAAWASDLSRWPLLLLWTLFLAGATHRLVEWADGAVADRWLGLTVRRLRPSSREMPRCRIAGLSAR